MTDGISFANIRCMAAKIIVAGLVALILPAFLACSRAESQKQTSDTGVTDSGTTTQMPCPKERPKSDSDCAAEGLRCAYGDALVDYLCTNELRWSERHYSVPPASELDAGTNIEQPAGTYCYSDQPSCPDNDVCVVECCGGGAGNGCAGCCRDKFCNLISVNKCPIGRCRLARTCSGEIVCRTAWHAAPSCGTAGSTDGPCCEGLTTSCGVERSDGSCDAESGGYEDLPYCIACGDGVCESPENRCSCPADCNKG